MMLFDSTIRRVAASVRLKLLAIALVPVAVIAPLALLGLALWSASFTYDQLYIKVNTDLAVAHDTFERIKRDELDYLFRLSESHRFRSAMAAGDQPAVRRLLDELKQAAGFSFIRVINPADSGPAAVEPTVGIEILGPEQLADIDPSLADFVRLPIVETARARPSQRKLEQRGMVIRARQPVLDARQNVMAILDGGVLLNNNFGFVDAIRDLVYGPGSLPAGSIGTVTVFLEDVRISNNVPQVAGARALGTRVSNEVVRAVLDEGRTWIDRAFVVNDWYISAYEPIVDINGKRVGILYAGYLEAPFRQALWRALGLTVAILAALLLLYLAIAVKVAKSVFRPLEKMSRVVHSTRLGHSMRVGPVDSQDELAVLAGEFDGMLDRLEEHAAQIRSWAEQLEEKVRERTAELQQRNAELQRTITVLRDTRRKLVTAEKLAALGELTAGVAHEINNPTQVMLGNLDVMMSELGDSLDPVRDEADLVVEQIYRIQAIVEKLLKYARPADYAGYLNDIDVNQVVRDTVALVAHMRSQHAFRLDLELNASCRVSINEQELQQVLVNLVSNAVHALPDIGGQVTISTEDWDQRGVAIHVRDNGMGIDAEQCSQIFDPFYSTKREGEGTGLGLSVSYGLVRRYGGDINVRSKPGHGTTFVVRLLQVPEIIDDPEAFEEHVYTMADDAETHCAGTGLEHSGPDNRPRSSNDS
jgi:two-component system NtrC family sensor kinase